MDNNSLAHTKWEGKYHIALYQKYRRQVIYKDIKADVGEILGTLCRRKRNGDNRGRMLPRLYPYVGENTAEIFSIKDCRRFKEKKFADDI